MIAWFTSLSGAVTLSVLAMLSFVAYALFVYRYLIEQLMPGIPGAVVQTAFVLLLLGVWIWSLFAAVSGNRSGLILALICTCLPALLTLYDMLLYYPIRHGWPLLQMSVWSTFGLSVTAVAALAYQLRVLGGVGG